MLRAAQAALQHGAASVLVAASHAVFTQGADEALADAAVQQVIVTNSAGGRIDRGAARHLAASGASGAADGCVSRLKRSAVRPRG
jgi:phosphoribosylpyrophosphate synthetase